MDIQIDVTGREIETKRLLLRPWLKSDLNDFYEYASVEDIGKMAGWKPHDSIEETKTILQSFINEKNELAIVLKDNDKVIGSLGFHNSWLNDEPEYKELKHKQIGYVLSKSYWGNGLMPEAVKEVIKFCFANYSLDALTVIHSSTNYQSQRVIEKSGFRCVNQSGNSMKYILYR